MGFNRRQLIKGLGSAAVASGFSSIYSPLQAAEDEKSALVIIQLRGGFNALFNSPNSLLNVSGAFGVTDSNVVKLKNGLMVDKSFERLGSYALNHMATIGVKHGHLEHAQGRLAAYAHNDDTKKNAALMIAQGIGGKGLIKAVNAVNGRYFEPYPKDSPVSYEAVMDLDSANEALGVENPKNPSRNLMAMGIKASKVSDKEAYAKNSDSLRDQARGVDAAIVTLGDKTTKSAIDLAALETAYGLKAGSRGVSDLDFKSQMAAAELMIRSGTNLVAISQNNAWDTHGDSSGTKARDKMNLITPYLETFIKRMIENEDGYNVVVMITAEFCRSLPGSDHAGVTTSTVIGKYVNPGVSAVVDRNIQFPTGTPGYQAQWAYISEALKVPELAKTFGGNPYKKLIVA